jgi:glycosyltransferase involved in cell wall biosynthesis
MRRRILFLTVMPSPYQKQLFQALYLDNRMEIRVLYYTHSAIDRNWLISPTAPYEEILRGGTIGWLGPSAHLNLGIVETLKKDCAELVVLSDYSAPTTQIAMHFLTHRKKPWVYWGEIPGLNPRRLLGRLLRQRLQRPILNGARAIAAIGSAAVNAYRILFPRIPVFNVPYFCDLTPFRAAATERWTRRKRTIDVLFSGQLIERKGVDLLVRAFAQISGQVPELHLQLLGTGPALDVLMGMIPVELRNRVHFLGFHQPADMPKIFAAADMFVLPSRHDGWGVVVNEALGSGLPIIVNDHVGARDLVEDGRNGFITIAGDIDSLASALLKLGRSSDLRKAFGYSSAERAAHWDLDEGVRRWVELSSQILNG